MGKFDNGLPSFTPASRAEWRKWLAKNHRSSTGVWLVYHKKATGRASVSYAEAVEEALCFGWIDSKINPIDAHTYKQVFTPRKAGSNWSKLNKTRVEALVAAGKMTKAGLAKIEAAKKDGSWATLDAVESLAVPDDLQSALTANPPAADHFAAFSPSCRKAYLYWINGAKRPETRAKRITEAVELIRKNQKQRLRPTPV